MWLFLVVFGAICGNLSFGKEVEKVVIGVFLNDEHGQLSIPLNNIVHINNYEGKNVPIDIVTHVISKEDAFVAKKNFCSFVESTPRLVAVVMPELATASQIVQTITHNLNLPYIQTSWHQSNSFSGGPTSINFYPDFELFSLGLAKLVESLHWSNFVLLYEDFDGFMRLQEILHLYQIETKNHKSMVVVKELNFNKNIKLTLKELEQSGEKKIIVDCDVGHTMQVLEYAKELGIMSFAHNYFLTSLDAHTLDLESLNVQANITTVRMLASETQEFNNTIQSWKNTEFIDMRPTDLEPYKVYTESVLVYDSIKMLVESLNSIYHERGLIIGNLSCQNNETFEYGLDIVQYMSQHYLTSASLPYPSFDDSGRRTNFTLFLVESNRDNVLATWNSLRKDYLDMTRSAEETRSKQVETLQTRKIVISSRLEEPYLMMNENYGQKAGEPMYKGYALDLMNAIAEKLNFTFEIMLTQDQYNGRYNWLSDSWNGIIGDIINERALFGISDLTITPDREAVVDFSMPFMRLGVGILLRKSNPQVSMFAFLKPFLPEVWMYTATLYLSLSIVLYFVARMAPGDWENPHPCNLNPQELENIWNVKNCMWLTGGSIMNQGSDILPRGISSRLVTSMWWFFALIVTNSYIASLAAFLTVQVSVIDDLEDLAKQSRIRYGALKTGSTREFFRQSNYSTYRRMYANMELASPSVYADTTREGVQLVRGTEDGTYAFLMESSTIEYLIKQNCDLVTVDQWFNNIEYGIAMILDCPYRTLINDAILNLQESNVLSDLKRKWWEREKGFCSLENAGGDELKMESVGGIFLVLATGLTLALFLGIIEFMWTVRQTSIDEHVINYMLVQDLNRERSAPVCLRNDYK